MPRLIWLAGREGMQPDLVERLYRAYFVNGEDIGTHETLTKIATDAGNNALLLERLQGVENLLDRDTHGLGFPAVDVRKIPFRKIKMKLHETSDPR
jgi:2-hydroxychromene-2-carboxylate isomerase